MKNKLQAQKLLDSIDALMSAFPDIFNPIRPKPLALGMTLQLSNARRSGKLNISCAQQKMAMKYWVNRPIYRRAVAGTPFRYNLDGSVFGLISDDHRQRAIDKLKAFRKAKKARKAAVYQAKIGVAA